MTHSTLNNFENTLRFALASALTGIMSAVVIFFVLAKERQRKNQSAQEPAKAFLADKQKAFSFYRVFSATYDVLNPPFYTDTMRSKIAALIEGEGLLVLDVGCGTGYTTKGILNQKGLCEVVGLDMNPVQLGRAIKNLRGEKARTFLSRGDAENLPFVDETFDVVVSIGAIEYFPNPEQAVKEMTRVAKRGGVVVVGGPEYTWFRKFALHRFFYTPSKAEVEEFFVKAGLEEEKTVLTGVDTAFGTRNYVVVAAGRKA
jgi:ubiquinone/menaquinone biosynthesis C-methylase UbiE